MSNQHIKFDIFPLVYPSLNMGDHEIKRIVHKIAENAGLPEGHLEFHVVDDATMANVNEEHMKVLGPTNVISFRLSEDVGQKFQGIMLINYEAVLRESALYQQPAVHYFASLVCHGMIHLLGYDHGQHMEEHFKKVFHSISSELDQVSTFTNSPTPM